MSDQRYYDIVAQELQSRILRPGLWARAVAETGGEGAAARALYIRYRVAELTQQEKEERVRAEEQEAQRRHAEEQEVRQLRVEAWEALRRRREDKELAEQARADAERAASPFPYLAIVGIVLVGMLLLLLLGEIWSR